VEKEHRWLPKLASLLPVTISAPLAKGEPAHGYPFPWSVYRWIDGEAALHASVRDMDAIAKALAEFLTALHRIDTSDGPEPGPHNFYRGAPLEVYAQEARKAITTLGSRIDGAAAATVLNTALASTWQHLPVWVHGDVAAGNLLLDQRGCLSAVIDFGCMGVGDPACDLAIAWTFFRGPARDVFCSGLALDRATWARGRGWTLWKALITLARIPDDAHPLAAENRRVITEVIGDHKSPA
jgi:aminoglycoside phosphotransferase (APT) family kinase protein